MGNIIIPGGQPAKTDEQDDLSLVVTSTLHAIMELENIARSGILTRSAFAQCLAVAVTDAQTGGLRLSECFLTTAFVNTLFKLLPSPPVQKGDVAHAPAERSEAVPHPSGSSGPTSPGPNA